MLLDKINSAWSRVLLSALIATLFTIICVEISKDRGRLIMAPSYDDVFYFKESLNLLKILDDQGINGTIQHYLENGMHSPFSIVTASLSYFTLGVFDAAPYYGNVIIVFITLVLSSYFLRGTSFIYWLLTIILFLLTPFMIMGVVEFRPDIFWAVILGFNIIYTTTAEPLKNRYFNYVISGSLVGICLLIKPTTFAMTLVLSGAAALLRTIINEVHPGSNFLANARCKIFFTIKAAAVTVGSMTVIALPYWWNNYLSVWTYFTHNSFGGKQALWAYTGSSKESLLFYLTGDASRSNTSYPGLIMTLLMLALIIIPLNKALAKKCIPPFVILFFAYCINTYTPIKSPFLGGAIYGTLFFLCFYVYGKAYLNPCNGLLTKPRLNILFLTAAVFCVLLARWPLYSDWGKNRVVAEAIGNANKFLYDSLNKNKSNPPKSILILQATPITHEYTMMWYIKERKPVKVATMALYHDIEHFHQQYPAYEWIVTQSPETPGSSLNLPFEKNLAAAAKILEGDDNYSVAFDYEVAAGKNFKIYTTNKSHGQ